MAKKTITKEHPLTAFRKANEVRNAVVKKSITKYQAGATVSDNTRVENPYKKSYPDLLKKNDPDKLTGAELDALSHQRRGMGDSYGTYVKKSGSIMNDLGELTSKQQTQLNNYMNGAPLSKKIYELLPNVGRIVGSSAADIPKGSKLLNQKKGGSVKYKTGGATKATKFAALAPPFNKATAADRIAGAKKNASKKK